MTYFIRTKTNRLKKPAHLKKVADPDANDRLNWCGQPVAQIGDFVFENGSISAGTVGRVVSIGQTWQSDGHYSINTSAEVEGLDGKIHLPWLYHLTVIDYSAVQEVKDFYVADGRPDRIKVSW